MGRFENEAMNNFQYLPGVWFGYVDDIFTVIGTNKSNVKKIVKCFHNKFTSSEFTYESEHNDKHLF